jgi:hypothetical protein
MSKVYRDINRILVVGIKCWSRRWTDIIVVNTGMHSNWNVHLWEKKYQHFANIMSDSESAVKRFRWLNLAVVLICKSLP